MLKGRPVPAAVGPGVRPTAARVREALFSIVGQDLTGWSVLDAFAGTGLLAFEAASRGAGPVTLVERDRRVARAIAENARALGVSVDLRIGDAARILGSGERWDLVLVDPPYDDDPARWARIAAPAAARVLVVEHRARREVPGEVGGLALDRRRVYGDTALAVFRVGGEGFESGKARPL